MMRCLVNESLQKSPDESTALGSIHDSMCLEYALLKE